MYTYIISLKFKKIDFYYKFKLDYLDYFIQNRKNNYLFAK